MIFEKDGLSKEKLIELLNYSLKPECQFVISDSCAHRGVRGSQLRSAIRFLNIEEKSNSTDFMIITCYSVKVKVEEKHWEKKEGSHPKDYPTESGIVDKEIFLEVARILSN